MAIFNEVYKAFHHAVPNVKIILQTYYESIEQYQAIVQLPVAGIGLDFIHDDGQNLAHLQTFGFPSDKVLAAGVIDGRNVWKANLHEQAALIETLTNIVERTSHYPAIMQLITCSCDREK